ncbi:MAG: tRNA 2-thiocytidine biosynthesis TtcA family protein [Anaerolineae bacterium]
MTKLETIARYLLKHVNRAVREFDLIEDGDRIAVGVSGGKDSRTLLDLLVRGVDIPGDYEVVAVHVDGSEVSLPALSNSLQPWFRDLGVEYEITPLEVPEGEPLPMDCFRCAWNRRKSLFFAADRLGCNKVAFGHHADDAAATTLMSILYKGQLETMEPWLSFFEGRFIVIRPLIYVAEMEIARYARTRGWKITEVACPQATEGRRGKMERFLRSFDKREYEQIRANLWRMAKQATKNTEDGKGNPDNHE